MPTSDRIQKAVARTGGARAATEVEHPAAARTAEATHSGLTRLDRIRLAAYSAAERRGFAPGHEESDWSEAERQVDAQAHHGQDDGAAA